MNKLIEKDDCGNWSLKGVHWSNLMPGALITKDTYEKVYAALWKLMEYEETDHTPTMIRDIERFAKKEHKRAMEYAIQIDEMSHWIPVSERLPEPGKEVLVQWELYDRCEDVTYVYINKLWINKKTGEWIGEFGVPIGKVVAWMELPEPYKVEEVEQ